MKDSKFEVVQLLVGHMQNFSYIISSGGRCAIVDPSFGGRIVISEVRRRSLKAEYILSTHSHFDHNNDNEKVRQELNAKVCAHPSSPVQKDVPLDEGSELGLGEIEIRVISTPGHTPDSVCYLAPGCVFTGDTLFVGTCGRADLPGSDPRALFRSLKRLGSLPPHTTVYPGHDYGSSKISTIGRELAENPAMQQENEEEFESFVLG